MFYHTKLGKKIWKNIWKFRKMNKKIIRHVLYHPKKLLLGNSQFPSVIYILILFLYMNSTTASFITAKDSLTY